MRCIKADVSVVGSRHAELTRTCSLTPAAHLSHFIVHLDVEINLWKQTLEGDEGKPPVEVSELIWHLFS